MLHELSLETLDSLDFGKVSVAFKKHLQRLAHDCKDRPGDGKARTVTMTFAVVPVLEADGSCDRVKLQVQVASKVPTHRTSLYDLALRPNGSFVFSEDSPTHFDQSTLFDEDTDR